MRLLFIRWFHLLRVIHVFCGGKEYFYTIIYIKPETTLSFAFSARWTALLYFTFVPPFLFLLSVFCQDGIV